ncbi:pilus assembly protein TadG-related protein [Devosia sp.]|uniref:pilus assembly protein TadG-related protein n=1 Tax=Devosia sp. TaxID=1871048 RepID=UPI003A8DBD1A
MNLFRRLRRIARGFARSASGNVAIIFAVTLPLTLGAGALVAEYGHAMVVSAKTQRVADLAAYAGALALASTSSEDSMRLAGQHVAALNGLAPAEVTLALVPSPRDGTKQAVEATVSVDKPLYLAPILGVGPTLTISSEAFAQVAGGTSACILALDGGGTGVTMSGGTHITATNCAVASNNSVTVPCGTTITAKQLSYNSAAAPTQPCGGITAASITKAETADPFSGNAGISAAQARFATLSGQTAPVAPAFAAIAAPPEGKSIEFGWNTNGTKAQASALGCVADKVGNTWVFTCPSGGTYNIKNMSLGGGLNLDFNLSAAATYTFSGDVSTTSTSRFGPGNYLFGGNLTTNWGTTLFSDGNYLIRGNLTTNGTTSFGNGSFSVMGNVATNGTTTFGSGPFAVNGTMSVTGTTKIDENGSGGSYSFVKGINAGGGATTVIGAGTFQMGRSTINCSGVYYSICNTSTLTFKGPSVFALSSGVFNSGGSRLTLGQGSSNSYWFGPSSNGDALSLAGGSQTFLADALGAGVYQFIGHVNASAGGGSCLVIGAAPQHDINGDFNGAGGVVLGAGVYTVDGFFALGANGGGATNCASQTVAVKAEDVTLVISGRTTFPYGDCAGKAFCVTAGYSNIRLSAPTSGPLANVAVIGPSANSNGAIFTGGASGGKISGAFYFANGAITMNGGAGASGGTNCLQLVGTQISMSGGTVLASECEVAGASAGGGRVSLVQ